MISIQELFGPWLYCQTKLEKTLRWRKYVLYENGKSIRYNGMRRQNVVKHTLSKLLVFGMLLPKLKKIFGKKVDFDLLWQCIVYHDFGEGLRGEKYDVSADDKKDFHDVEEYKLIITFLEKCGLEDTYTLGTFEKAFLLQFVLTSHKSFPAGARMKMALMRKNLTEKNTAILFQIIEKWEYLFYAHEHRDKHPNIWNDVYSAQKESIPSWIKMYPKKFRKPLENIFLL